MSGAILPAAGNMKRNEEKREKHKICDVRSHPTEFPRAKSPSKQLATAGSLPCGSCWAPSPSAKRASPAQRRGASRPRRAGSR